MKMSKEIKQTVTVFWNWAHFEITFHSFTREFLHIVQQQNTWLWTFLCLFQGSCICHYTYMISKFKYFGECLLGLSIESAKINNNNNKDFKDWNKIYQILNNCRCYDAKLIRVSEDNHEFLETIYWMLIYMFIQKPIDQVTNSSTQKHHYHEQKQK